MTYEFVLWMGLSDVNVQGRDAVRDLVEILRSVGAPEGTGKGVEGDDDLACTLLRGQRLNRFEKGGRLISTV